MDSINLKVKKLDLETGANVVLVNESDATRFGLHPGDRVEITLGRSTEITIVNLTSIIKPGSIGLTKEASDSIKVSNGDIADIRLSPLPQSLVAIKNKLNGRRLDSGDLYAIVKDAVEKKLDRSELTAFIVALHAYGLDNEETEYMSRAMVNTGETLNLKKKNIYDKHSIGGVPGDKTSLLLVPIIAAAGLTIPKTSSRAITSAAGTADRAEVIMPVSLSIHEMEKVVNKTNGCIVWGGSLHLAPADDIFIKIEYPFSLDPLLLPSIMSKKKAVGSTDLVLDVPTGSTVKVKSIDDASLLLKDFITLGQRMGIRVQGLSTYGEQPIGNSIGAAAEAKEALYTIMRSKGGVAEDLVDKATSLAGVLLEMSGKAHGKVLARRIWESGKAEKKLREIIAEQGGDPKIKPEDIAIGKKSAEVVAEDSGKVIMINNLAIAYIARIAGAPMNKEATVILHKKLGDEVKKGEKILSIYASSAPQLASAEKYAIESMPLVIAKGNETVLKRIIGEKKPETGAFVIER